MNTHALYTDAKLPRTRMSPGILREGRMEADSRRPETGPRRRGKISGRAGGRSLSTKNNLTREEARIRAAAIRDVGCRITLDLTHEDSFSSESLVSFTCTDPGSDTFLDLTAPGVTSIEVNGRAVPTDAFDGNRVRLTGLRARNEIKVTATCRYYRTEVGMHRFIDPVDEEVYLH